MRMSQVRALHPLPHVLGALTHWLSTCLSNRTKPVRFRHASPVLPFASLAKTGKRATLKPWMFRVQISGDAPRYCPRGETGRRHCLKTSCDARSNRAGDTKYFLRPYGAILADARDRESRCCRFESCYGHHARLAESGRGSGFRSRNFGVQVSGRAPIFYSSSISSVVEHALDKREALGSFPRSTTKLRAIGKQSKPAACKTVDHRRCKSDSRVHMACARTARAALFCNFTCASTTRARASHALVAQLEERLPCKQDVGGSNPSVGTNRG
jgi:hypothetical protein